jgi:hypothetical protein
MSRIWVVKVDNVVAEAWRRKIARSESAVRTFGWICAKSALYKLFEIQIDLVTKYRDDSNADVITCLSIVREKRQRAEEVGKAGLARYLAVPNHPDGAKCSLNAKQLAGATEGSLWLDGGPSTLRCVLWRSE